MVIHEVRCYLTFFEASFKSMSFLENKKRCSHLIMVLVGCKNDLEDSHQTVPTKKAREFAKKNGFCLFFETSSKDKVNIKDLFEELSMELISNYIKYLNFQEEQLNLVSIPCTNRSFMIHQNTIPLNALSSKSDVYFNCTTEKLNCNHIILNNKNSRRKNLQTKRLLDFF